LPVLSADHLNEVQHLQPIFTLWAASEPELSPALLAISAALEKVGSAEQNLVKGFSQHVNQVNINKQMLEFTKRFRRFLRQILRRVFD
jgi:hypothetical protein